MKQSINLNDFRNAFREMNRDNYSYNGYEALYNFFAEVSPEFELDVIAICCEFSEYGNDQELLEAYGADSMKEIYNNTIVLQVEGSTSFIVQDY